MNHDKVWTIGVVGAGNMGSGIAHKYASHGHDVVIVDRQEAALLKSQQSMTNMLNEGVRRAVITESNARATLDRVSFSHNLTDFANCELVIEAVFEDLSVKRELFSTLENICTNDTIFATNTSSLLVGDMQHGLMHPERVIGLHYFFPVVKNRLVEVIGTSQSDENVVEAARRLQQSINKTVIVSKDSPGFIVNRFFVPWLNEAMHIVNEGITNVATVERAAKKFFQIGMGPFTLMNVTGLPITFHASKTLAQAFGEFYAPCPSIKKHMDAGLSWDINGSVDEGLFDYVGLRLLAVVASIAHQLVYNENVTTAKDVDIGANIGLMWPEGPFALMAKNQQRCKEAIKQLRRARPAFFVPSHLVV